MKESELKALLSLLDDEDPEIFDQIRQKINDMGTEMIPILESEWEKNFNPLVQKRIENLTHDLQFRQVKERLYHWKEEENDNLLKGLWVVSTYQFPDLEYMKLSAEIDQIYYEVWTNFRPDLHPFDQIKILNSFMFQDMKFSANTKNFHSPSNSFINQVLETRRGNPITMCSIYMLIAQKMELPVFGVNLPNLFIVTYKHPNFAQFYINVYNKGLIFSMGDIENYIKELKLEPLESFFQPCNNIEIIKRVFRNLIVCYEKAGEKEKMNEIMELASILEDPLNI